VLVFFAFLTPSDSGIANSGENMRRVRICSLSVGFAVLLSLAGGARSQIGMLGYGQYLRQGLVNGGIGYASIDNESYVAITFHPELAVDKVGIGLNVYFLYNTRTGHIRSQDWDEDYDYFRLIRYARYGWKGDSFYTRVGTLDAARLGHGFIMNYYTNEASWDRRKIGLVLDVDFGRFGFESIGSNLGRAEIIGGRVYYKPLRDITSIPVIRNLTAGATFVTDLDPDEDRDTEGDRVTVYGLDVELPFIDTDLLWTALYTDFAKIDNFGSGRAIGIGVRLKNLGGLAHVEARLERRWLGKEFLPGYFDAFYEIDRFVPLPSGSGVYKKDLLKGIQEDRRGIFGELYARVLGLVDVFGSYQKLDDEPNSGILHVGAMTSANVPMFALQATYDKKNIGSFRDIRTLDNRSIARVGIGYKINPFLMLFMDYIWTFSLDEETNQYVPQERYAPRLVFNYQFSL
jgi:hypothetical protein